MRSIVINHHRGLGDHLICNAIVRDRAAKFDRVFLPCKAHNMPSVEFMFRDLSNVKVVSVADDQDADSVTKRLASEGSEILGLGMFGPKPFNIGQWDKEMYRQADIPFEDRWDKWHVMRDKSQELTNPKLSGWTFCHQDTKRRFEVDVNKLPRGNVICPKPYETRNILNYWSWIENAEEIHVVDSCFCIFADSIPTKAKRHVLHLYARPGALPPHYRKNWEILR